MKKILITIALGILLIPVSLFGQGLGLPDNSAHKPARAARTNTSYSAIISYPTHSEEIYFDLGQMTSYIKTTDRSERRIEKMDSLVTYQLHDNKKSYEVISLQGITAQAKTTKKLDVKLEEAVYAGRWCIIESYKQVENDISLEGGKMSNAVESTEFEVYTDMETGIVLREDQNGGTMMSLSNISLGAKPDRRFGIPSDYTKTGGRDMGKLISDMKNAQDAEDPAAAMQELIKNLNQYRTK